MAKLLLVEDDPLISRMYEKAFAFDGYEIELAADGNECLSLVKTNKPDLILLDIMMPGLNGLQVLEQLKADEATKSIPVIMLTNMAGQNDIEEALKRGAVKYIVKGEHTPKEVIVEVKQVLAGYIRDDLPPVV